MRKIGIKILLGSYLFFVLMTESFILMDAVTSKVWKFFIQSTIIIFLFSIVFISGIILIGKREIVDCRIENDERIKLFPMIGGMICVNRDDIMECNEYLHMFTVMLSINKKKMRFRLSKKYFPEIPWE